MACITFKNTNGVAVSVAVQHVVLAEYSAGRLVISHVNNCKSEFDGITPDMFDELRKQMEACK